MSLRSLIACMTAAGALALAAIPAGAAAAASGALDAGFGASGVVQAPAGAQLYGVAVDGYGNTFAAGTLSGRIFVERLSPAGVAAGTYLGPSGVAHAVAVGPDGDVLVAGTAGGAMVVQKLSPDLALAVWTATAFSNTNAVANGLAVAGDGSPIAVGASGAQTAAAEFTPAGALRWTQAGFGSDQSSQLNAAAVQPSGSIVVVGSQRSPRFINGLVAQLSGAGAVQQAFLAYYPNDGTVSLNAAATQPDGSVAVVGATDTPEVLAIRITPGGAVDGTFGRVPAPGYQSTAALPSGQNVNVPNYPFGGYGVGIAAGNRVIAAGNYENTGVSSDQALWAFTPSGQPDGSLIGGNGTTSPGPATVVGPSGSYEACGMAIDPTSGNIVTVGDSINSYPVANPCALDTSTSSNAGQGFVSRLIGFGPVPAPTPAPPPPPAPAPHAVTGTAIGVTPTQAQLTGGVNPEGQAATYRFEYGRTSAYDSLTPAANAGAGSTSAPASATVTGLTPGTTYHYRLDATSTAGSAAGADATFTTPAAPGAGGLPRATTGRAASTEVGAVITGGVDSGGLPTTYYVQYGPTSRYGSSTRFTALPATPSASRVSTRLSRLRLGTRYHYRVVASNALGTSRGADRTFTTLPRLVIVVSGLSGHHAIGTLLARRLTIRISCNQACRITAAVQIPATVTRSLRLGKQNQTIARGTAWLRRRGTVVLTLRPSAPASAALAHVRRLGGSLQLVISPAGGGPKVAQRPPVSFG